MARSVALDYYVMVFVKLLVVKVVARNFARAFVIAEALEVFVVKDRDRLFAARLVGSQGQERALNYFTVHRKVFVLGGLYQIAGHFVHAVAELADFVAALDDNFFSGKFFLVDGVADHDYVACQALDRAYDNAGQYPRSYYADQNGKERNHERGVNDRASSFVNRLDQACGRYRNENNRAHVCLRSSLAVKNRPVEQVLCVFPVEQGRIVFGEASGGRLRHFVQGP